VFRLLTNRRVLISVGVVAVLLAVALWPSTIPVETATVSTGPLMVTVDEEGQTRVRDRFVVSAPVYGRVLRIELEPGDRVERGQEVARLRAEPPPLLDARTRAEAEAAVASAQAALGRARAEEQRTRAALTQAQRELQRARELAAAELATRQLVDTREAEAETAAEAANAARFAVQAAAAEVDRARARVDSGSADSAGRVVDIPSPADGVVLRRVRESESVVPAGEALVEIGDPSQLEIVSDLLSTDAVSVKAGARALIDQWGGGRTLEARVRRVEPSGFTKVSALGVEEQRVNVILDFVDPAGAWQALGDAYRVEVRIVVWEGAAVLKVPTSALFRVGDAWAVYLIEGDRVRQTTIEIGHQTGQEAEVTSGLSEGTRLVVHPPDTLADGARVEPR
jgi:HlyD family secretion protein